MRLIDSARSFATDNTWIFGQARAAAESGIVSVMMTSESTESLMWDTSEYIAAAYVLGIPHPPGNPFFVLIGRVFAILPIALSVAMRMSSLASSM